MPSRAWFAANKTLLVVVASILVAGLLFWLTFIALGTSSGGVDIGPIETGG